MNITKKTVCKDYNKLKKMACGSLKKDRLSDCMTQLAVLSRLMYDFNILFADDAAEHLLHRISTRLSEKHPICNTRDNNKVIVNENRILFYDWFALDNRGLTIIYLKALLELGYHVLYITYKHNKPQHMKRIRELIQSDEKSEIYKLKNTDPISASKELRKVITSYKPGKAFAHTTPDDIIGLTAFSCFEGHFDRYLINITDHAFWLGKSAFDYYIEFRSYGYNISLKHREINREKLMILPYYPAPREEEGFQGFPFSESGKRIIFSGGSFTKIRGSNLFYKIIKHIIDQYEDTIFLFAGSGDNTAFQNFISSNHYENRVYCIQERSDLSEVMKRCYFYLSTYPMIGGLMSQYAVLNGKIPMTFRKKEQLCDETESVFLHTGDIKLTYTNVKDYIREIDQLLGSPAYLKEQEKKLTNLIISEEQFARELKHCMDYHTTSIQPENQEFDIEKAYQYYLSDPDENAYLKLLSKLRKEDLLVNFPMKYLYSLYKANKR